jgi:hypothetical protein
MKKLIAILCCAALLCGAAFSTSAQTNDPVVDKVLELAAQDNQTMDHLDVLCNTIGPRLTGSDGYLHAVDWAMYMFQKWGLEVEKVKVGELPIGFSRGPWSGRMINGEEALHFTTPSYTAGTHGVQRGHVVIEPKTTAEFERMKHTIKGAWVLIGGKNSGRAINYGPAGEAKRAKIKAQNDSIAAENGKIRGYNYGLRSQRAELEKKIAATTSKKEIAKLRAELDALVEKKPAALIEEPALFYKEMIEAGALGIIQSSAVPITTLSDRENIYTMTWETLPVLPDIKLDERQYKKIYDRVALREYIQLEFDIRNHFFMGPVPYYNVLAYIRGTEKPEELIISSCHLDCYDVSTGGVDCGTGVAPAMEAARLLAAAGAKPRRTIVFALWAAEEFGLLGSKHYVENNVDKHPYIVNVFNRDGGPTVANSWSVPTSWYAPLKAVCAPLENLNPDMPFTLTEAKQYPVERPKTAGGSDHAHFVMNGVPALSFGTGDPLGYNFSYSEIWHTDRDLYNMSIPPYMEHTAVVNAVVFWGLANLEERLPQDAVYKK